MDEATSTKGEEDEDSSMLSQVEGSVGHLVMYLMPQVFIVAIFRKAQQVGVCLAARGALADADPQCTLHELLKCMSNP